MRNRLFDRLSGEAEHTRHLSDIDALCLSIKQHISQLIGIRQGSAMTVPQLGLPDLNSQHMSPFDAIQHIRREIERVIHQFEPRLHEASVKYLGDVNNPLNLTFNIEGNVMINGSTDCISFSTHLNNHDRRRVECS
ncbi:type VI secretion system baseplate subunit TssE [Photobacterium sp.]|uniref:type VI secretion system baseplate subunit TssE n=1 Tax=Photobacterium sp. TaxID=660 RepID=UPI00299CD751|nr:type VI secretion system baseplate subunit TssE [Photobacterium sp.]MDX1302265.1 type VI secretion system baseplate subunit TssE [Photobacterium sp.]